MKRWAWLSLCLLVLVACGQSARAPAESQSPAAGICGGNPAVNLVVSIDFNIDTPAPRCQKVVASQRLQVTNHTSDTLDVKLARFAVQLARGQTYLFDAPFGAYLALGVHSVSTSSSRGASGAELWLVPVGALIGTPAAHTLSSSPVTTVAGGMSQVAATPPATEDLQPLALPAAPGMTLSPLSAGCPNPQGVEPSQDMPVDTVVAILTKLGSGKLTTMRQASDPAFWPLLQEGHGTMQPIARESVGKAEAAAQSPYAGLLANACGHETLDNSWWVRLCPGHCDAPKVATSASLTGHAYFIKRRGVWLLWAEK